MKKYVGKYIGQGTPDIDAKQKATGAMAFGDDLRMANLLHGKILFSPHAHARVVSIDTGKAEALPGVRAVVTYKDNPKNKFNSHWRWYHDSIPGTEAPLEDEPRFVGDRIAAVAADTEEIAAKALRLIEVEYEILPAVFNEEEALKEGAPLVYPEGNLLKEQKSSAGDVDKALEESDLVVSQELKTSFIHHATIEPHMTICQWKNNDELEIWGPMQAVYRNQVTLSRLFDIPISKIMLHGTDIGGSFGGKDGVILEGPALILSKKAGGYPVKIRLNRTEAMISTFGRHIYKLYGKMGVTKEGKITGFGVDTYMNAGAYCGASINVLAAMCGKMFKMYDTPNMRFNGYAAYTNLPPGGAMRGFGSPAIFAELELMVNKAANALGMDQVEFRRKNLIEPFVKDPASGESLRSAGVKEALIKGAEIFEWERRKEEAKRKSGDRYAYGVGVAVGMHGNGVAPFASDITVSEISLNEDGTVFLRCAVTDHGAGTYTLVRQVVAETLQMPLEQVGFTHSDTKTCPYDMGAGASRNTWSASSSVWEVSRKLLASMTKAASELFGCDENEIRYEDGVFCCLTDGKTATREDIASYTYLHKKEKLIEVVSYNSSHNAGSYGAHFVEARVDKTTGEVRLGKYLAVYDVGTPLNPLMLTGQIEGAILQGIGMALFEGINFDDKGKATNAGFRRYRVPRASDMPDIQVEFVDNYEHGGPFGGKSIGEASIVPSAPAIMGAINNALGTDLWDMPFTPEKILEAINNK